jgi:hypothetical protein
MDESMNTGSSSMPMTVPAIEARVGPRAAAARPSGVDTAALVVTLKAPISEAIEWVNYHRNLGVDHIFLFFDDPAEAAEAEGPLSGRDGWLTRFSCDDEHWRRLGLESRPPSPWRRQEHNADLAHRMAREMGLDWLIHIDGDELLHVDDRPGAALAGATSEADVVTFRVMEAVPEALDYASGFREITLFRDWPRAARHRARIARRIGCEGAFLDGAYFRAHQLKSAVRLRSEIGHMGNHIPYEAEGRPLRTAYYPRVRLLHYDCGGYASWLRKWLPRIEGKVSNTGDGSRARQAELIRDAIERSPEGPVEAYRRIYWMRPREKAVLRALGLLRRIELPAALFAEPARGALS